MRNTFYIISAGMAIPKLSSNFFGFQDSHKREFDRLFANLDSGFLLKMHAGELGREYLFTQESNITEKVLITEFNPRKTPHTLNLKADFPAYDEIQDMIQSDFESDNTVRLQGWVLSETEAKLCALYRMTT